MINTNTLEDSIKLAKELGQEAISSVKDDNNESLVQIMQAMIEREF